MKWLSRIFISAGILGLLCLGAFITYNIAYGMGEAEGYDKGYPAGQKVGYSSGKADGYNLGKQDGHDEGYNLGKADGYEEGIEASLEHGYTLRDPTYKDAINFLRKDKTDSNEFKEDSYVCSHFARDVCNNAEASGFRCAHVALRFLDGGHSIIAFNTIDKGLLFFEPQFDDEVELVIGRSYSRLNGYERPDNNDTIYDILVIW